MMTGIKGINRMSLNTEPLQDKISRRNTEFSERIKAAILDVNDKQQVADDSIEKVIKGEMEIHEGMMAVSQAETSLKLLAQVRNKVMAAYNEVMRMQI
ncbi:MAG: flagellar hook-basal body complex protein FliE [Desulfobacula sp.]|jgi:flagellar hook-basal body complex protein FliE